MVRSLVAVVAASALLLAFVLAPHAHVHPAGSGPGLDAHHHHVGDATVRHAHLTSHRAAPRPAGQGPLDDDEHHHAPDRPLTVLVAGEFAFQAAAGMGTRGPVAMRPSAPFDAGRGVTLAPPHLQPPAHAPPDTHDAPSRAPPALPPAAV